MNRDRELERWILGEADPELRKRVHARAKDSSATRRVYDDYFSVMRALEARVSLDADDASELAESDDFGAAHEASAEELKWLEEEFFVTWESQPQRWTSRARSWFRWPRPLVLASAAAGLLIAAWLGFRSQGIDEGQGLRVARGGSVGLVARGRGRSAELEFEVLCGLPPQAVNDGRCRLDEQMSFAHRATRESAAGPDGRGSARVVTLFGIDERGELQYYAPTPAHPQGLPALGTQWQPAGFSVNLDRNHRAGELRVFALLAPRALRVEELAQLVPLFSSVPSAASASWLDGLEVEAPTFVKSLCPDEDSCEAVQTQLQILPASPTPG